MYELDYYDVIVVGAGHAGCEAAPQDLDVRLPFLL